MTKSAVANGPRGELHEFISVPVHPTRCRLRDTYRSFDYRQPLHSRPLLRQRTVAGGLAVQDACFRPSGSQLLVGAPNYSTTANVQVGQAYLFNPDTGALLRTFNDPEPANNVQFGQSVAMINHYAIIGAPGTAAYVFDANTGAYLAKIVNPGALTSPSPVGAARTAAWSRSAKRSP